MHTHRHPSVLAHYMQSPYLALTGPSSCDPPGAGPRSCRRSLLGPETTSISPGPNQSGPAKASFALQPARTEIAALALRLDHLFFTLKERTGGPLLDGVNVRGTCHRAMLPPLRGGQGSMLLHPPSTSRPCWIVGGGAEGTCPSWQRQRAPSTQTARPKWMKAEHYRYI
jgi:hypothetical protein